MEAMKRFLDNIAEDTTFRITALLEWDNPNYDMIECLAPALLSLDTRFRKVENGWYRLTAQAILDNRLAHFRLKYHLLLTNPDLLV